MPGAYLIVRATVADAADRPAFDKWYQTEHLPDAIKAFGATAAWRGWSQQDPSVHVAHYRFPSMEAMDTVMNGPIIKGLIAEFDRCWAGKVTRTREIIPVAEEH